jgi:hypothetical protein
MKIIDFSNTEANINLSKKEILIMQAALNEICNGIDLFEFETRLGASRDSVIVLLNLVSELLDKIDEK